MRRVNYTSRMFISNYNCPTFLSFSAPAPPPPVTARSVALPFSPAGLGRRTGRLAAVTAGICLCGLTTDRTEVRWSCQLFVIY